MFHVVSPDVFHIECQVACCLSLPCQISWCISCHVSFCLLYIPFHVTYHVECCVTHHFMKYVICLVVSFFLFYLSNIKLCWVFNAPEGGRGDPWVKSRQGKSNLL